MARGSTVGFTPDKPVEIGMKSKCVHCGQAFTLVDAKPHPLWKPDWQLETSKAVKVKLAGENWGHEL